MRLSSVQYLSIPKKRQEYLDWKKSKVTEEIIDCMTLDCEPRKVLNPSPEKALYDSGFDAGRADVLKRMLNLDKIHAVVKDSEADYGLITYLTNDGYSPEEAKIMVEKNKSGE